MFSSYSVRSQAGFHFRQKNFPSGRQVHYSVPVSLALCVCESESVLQRAFHGEKEGGNKRKGGSKGVNALVQEEVKEM